MWDEITVGVTAGADALAAVERVRAVVAQETAGDAQQAELEWRSSSLQRGLSRFSAEPDVNLRPSSAGYDLVVRYVTRAQGRFEQRRKLYACALEAVTAATPAQEAAPST